jgi:hypothetical protein
VVTALDNGLQIDFTGASSRNPYIKISKDVQIWGFPDTLRLRMNPGGIQFKLVKVLVETAYDERIQVEHPIENDGDEGMITIDIPVDEICDATDLGNFPLHLIYYYLSYNAVTTGEQYSLKIPGMELVYANMPQDVPLTGDVNGDGEVNIADVNCLIGVILGTRQASEFGGRAYVNDDDEVNIADVNAVIAIILRL